MARQSGKNSAIMIYGCRCFLAKGWHDIVWGDAISSRIGGVTPRVGFSVGHLRAHIHSSGFSMHAKLCVSRQIHTCSYSIKLKLKS
jgi:hypothetical protein